MTTATQQHESDMSEGARIAFLKKRKEEREEREAREAFLRLSKAPGWNTTTPEEMEKMMAKIREASNPLGTPVKKAG
jgi:hypothetical protein